ncbi:MAG: TolC family protein [Archangium sp.]|nr:TolC family protein [Archangium sp.]
MCPVILALVLSAGQPLDLSSVGDGASLPELVWKQSPELRDARIRIAQADAERRKALRLPNPGLDLGLNTIPVGPLNPPDLKDPFLNVPNVAVGLSVLLEIGKRGPRQEATSEAARAAALDALDLVRRRTLDLEDLIGDVASAQVRVDALQSLGADAQRLAELQAARADKGDTSALDADRAKLEVEGTLTAIGEAQELLAATQRACAEIVAIPCTQFADVTQANAWLDRHVRTGGPVEQRPDVRALEASIKSARAAQLLASRGWLPDPTVRFGYVRDQFVVSGNQQNSFFVGVSMPLPLFERGQDDAEAARIAAETTEQARARLLEAANAQLTRVDAEIVTVETRQKRVKEQSLPLARSVVSRLDAAVTRGAAPLQELLLARRTLAELLLTAAELDRTVFHLRVARARLSSSLELQVSP